MTTETEQLDMDIEAIKDDIKYFEKRLKDLYKNIERNKKLLEKLLKQREDLMSKIEANKKTDKRMKKIYDLETSIEMIKIQFEELNVELMQTLARLALLKGQLQDLTNK